jgi:hypothetical protein
MTDQLRDRRTPGWFWAYNSIVDVYGPVIGAYALAVYFVLVRHSNANGQSFPSIATIARLTHTSPHTVIAAIKTLCDVELLSVTTQTAPGKEAYISNLYTLLEPDVIRFDEGCAPHAQRYAPRAQGVMHDVHTKDDSSKQDSINKTDSSASAEAAVKPKPVSRKARSPKPEKAPTAVKAATDPEPPGSDAPPLPKPVQPHVAIIDAWRAALNGDAPITNNVYGGQYGRVAVALAQAGVTPEQVAAYTRATAQDAFWKGKVIPLENVAKNIRRWLKSQEHMNYGSNQTSTPTSRSTDTVVGGIGPTGADGSESSAPTVRPGKIPSYLHARLGVKTD